MATSHRSRRCVDVNTESAHSLCFHHYFTFAKTFLPVALAHNFFTCPNHECIAANRWQHRHEQGLWLMCVCVCVCVCGARRACGELRHPPSLNKSLCNSPHALCSFVGAVRGLKGSSVLLRGRIIGKSCSRQCVSTDDNTASVKPCN